jgi:protein-tyrosine kinase
MNIVENAIKMASKQAEARQLEQSQAESLAAAHSVAQPTEKTGVNSDALPEKPAIAFAALAESTGLVTDRRLMEQFRHLKRPVLKNAFGQLSGGSANVVMISSAVAGAGKTFMSVNLSNAMAMERDRPVCVIDLDNIRASLSTRLELANHRGFFDVVNDRAAELTDVMLPTDVPGLSIIPAGKRYADSAELLSSDRARELVRRLAAENPSRIILLDTPPILSTSDAHAIIGMSDQVLIVVAAGDTKRRDMDKVLETIDTEKPVGLIFNRAPNSHWLTEYGGYYYDPAVADEEEKPNAVA